MRIGVPTELEVIAEPPFQVTLVAVGHVLERVPWITTSGGFMPPWWA